MFWNSLFAADTIPASSISAGTLILTMVSSLAGLVVGVLLTEHRVKREREAKESLQARQDGIERGQVVHATQFRAEFGIYRSLWSKAVKMKIAAISLRPVLDMMPYCPEDPEKQRKALEEQKRVRRTKVQDSFNDFLHCYAYEEPFCAPNVYEIADKLAKIVRREVREFDHCDPKDYWENAEKTAEEIIQASDALCAAIRERISGLSIAVGDSNSRA